MNRIVRTKDYQRLFDIAESTAKKWIAKDRKFLNIKRLTARHVADRYGLDITDMAPVLV